MGEIIIHKQEKKLVVNISGDSCVMDILHKHNFMVYAPCGGNGQCGKCKIIITGDVNGITPIEQQSLNENELAKGIRLACQTIVHGSAHVHLLNVSYENKAKGTLSADEAYHLDPLLYRMQIEINAPTLQKGDSIIAVLKQELGDVKIGLDVLQKIARDIRGNQSLVCTIYGNELIDIEGQNEQSKMYGVAVDIGTTTVVCYLIDLTTGKQIAVASRQNSQYTAGADVVSRIQYTVEHKNGLQELKEKIIQTIDSLLEELLIEVAIDKRNLYHCVLVGNTTMIHLFLGLDCQSLSVLPFAPVTTEMIDNSARQIGFTNMNPNGKVVFMPGIGGFVGADTVGALIAARLEKDTENIQLLLDLGTNGEIVLSVPSGRYACSTAAGPAFEGANIKHGMQAFGGAIDAIHIGEDIEFHTIKNERPRGLCGSGLVDAVSELVRVGLIADSGRIMDPQDVCHEKLAQRIVKNGRQKEIIIVEAEKTGIGENITVTQKDIRQLQLAKGAIRAGINILLNIAQIPFDKVNAILLAGAFGNFVKKESAIHIGLFPPIALEQVISLGNGAGEGAKMALCDKNILLKSSKLFAEDTYYIELSSRPEFQDEFVGGMVLR